MIETYTQSTLVRWSVLSNLDNNHEKALHVSLVNYAPRHGSDIYMYVNYKASRQSNYVPPLYGIICGDVALRVQNNSTKILQYLVGSSCYIIFGMLNVTHS